MTLTQLIYFVKAAELEHLTEAARELMIAQPSLTQSLHKLENDLGFPLFEKTGRRISLSREGEEFYRYARSVVDAQRKAENAAVNIFQANKGLIRFAHTEPIPENYIPDLICDFMRQPENAGVKFESDVAGTSKIIRELRNDEIDFGFCSENMEKTDDLILHPVFSLPIVLITSVNSPLAQKEQVSLLDLLEAPCITYRTNSPMYHQLQDFWDRKENHPPIIIHSSAVHIKGLVARGLGWAFAAMTEELHDPDIKCIRLPEMKLERKMFLAMRAGRKHGPAADRFLRFVLNRHKKSPHDEPSSLTHGSLELNSEV